MLMPKGFEGMGFRDLRLFNQALLARQAWRLIQYPDAHNFYELIISQGVIRLIHLFLEMPHQHGGRSSMDWSC
jgi:hypothetical protein